jgi:cell division initiation protein
LNITADNSLEKNAVQGSEAKVKITPVDVRNQQFGKSFRGYDPSEVDSYLEMVCSTLEDLIKENAELKERLSSVESTLIGYKDLEGNLKAALVTAQKSAEEIRENAVKEAQLLMRETKMKADRNLEETHNTLSGLKKQIADLENTKKEYLARLKSLVETHLRVLESMEKEDQAYKEEPQLAGNRSQSRSNSDEEMKI